MSSSEQLWTWGKTIENYFSTITTKEVLGCIYLVGSGGGERDRVARIVGVSEGEDTEGGVVGEEEEGEGERRVPGRLEEADGVMMDREEVCCYRGHPRDNGFPLKYYVTLHVNR